MTRLDRLDHAFKLGPLIGVELCGEFEPPTVICGLSRRGKKIGELTRQRISELVELMYEDPLTPRLHIGQGRSREPHSLGECVLRHVGASPPCANDGTDFGVHWLAFHEANITTRAQSVNMSNETCVIPTTRSSY
jgi:hypothetical protein